MASDTREHEVREFLERMALEMPTPAEVPPMALGQARRRLIRTVAVGVAIAVIAVAGVLSGARALMRADQSRPADETQIEPIVAIPIEAGVPIDIAVGEGSVWVSGYGVFRIDPTTSEVMAAFPSASRRRGASIAVGEGAVWVSGGALDAEIIRIDLTTNELVETIHTGGYEDPYALATGAGYVWATTHNDGTLLRIDPATNVVEVFAAPRSAVHGVTVLDGVVWVVASDWDDGQGVLFGLDPASGQAVDRIPVAIYDMVTAGFGSLWGFSSRAGAIVRLDPSTDSVIASMDIGVHAGTGPAELDVAIGEGSVWVSLSRAKADDEQHTRILRIDPETNRVVGELAIDGPATAIAAGAGAVWVTDGLGTLYRIDPDAVRQRRTP